jgi:putative transposase
MRDCWFRCGENALFSSINRVATGHQGVEDLGVQRFQSYKFELRPSASQQRQMRRIVGCCRFVFNLALATQKERLTQGHAELTVAELSLRLAEWRARPESRWLADASIGPQLQALRDLERAFARHRARQAQFPRFRKRGRSDSFRHSKPGKFKLDQATSRLFLPQVGWLRYRNSREVLGQVRNVTVSASCEKWFVSILTQRHVAQRHAIGPAVGIDMGIARFATLSDGHFFAPLNSFRRHEKALAVAQRSWSRKIKYSNNWRKEKSRVQRIYVRIGNARRDYLNKVSTTISQNHAVVCIEDLRVSDMSQSASAGGDRAAGSARAKRGLNKSILDQGWFEFRRQLEYKLRWNGGRLIVVSPRNTSITCPSCGHVAKENRRSQAQFVCAACGFRENADVVGATNVLRAGHARLACAETSPAYEASGQEPTDAYAQDC